MRYQLQRKLFALGADFTVKDETGADRYIVDGKVFSIGHKLIITDMQGAEEATIHQRIIALRPTYEITRRATCWITSMSSLAAARRWRRSRSSGSRYSTPTASKWRRAWTMC